MKMNFNDLTTNAKKSEIESVIKRLTGLTLQAKIYGGESVLARCNPDKTAEQVFDIMNRALVVIEGLKNQEGETIKDLQNELKIIRLRNEALALELSSDPTLPNRMADRLLALEAENEQLKVDAQIENMIRVCRPRNS